MLVFHQKKTQSEIECCFFYSESDLDIKWEEAEHFATTMRDKTKVVEPPARTRAREMDLIRLLFARIKDFKALWLKIKKTPWQL